MRRDPPPDEFDNDDGHPVPPDEDLDPSQQEPPF